MYGQTIGGSLDLNVSVLSALWQCNLDKAGIKKIEASRSGRNESGSK
ncbi:Rz1 lytic protein [Escherichia coli]|nr:Rz1 lytic protein [Salmonella enterica subsp. enterica serovar Montevideo]EEV5554728.1 Rz1 lytic protein [Escherichia coli]EFX6130286.1 Rz1 lytic protein [Shigella boydii]MJU80553.1 Rz1 lytic protein [Shigella sonnei]EEV5813622.1 Rz1 lytic protein [Escherichia coli]